MPERRSITGNEAISPGARDAGAMAAEAGDVRAANTVLPGTSSPLLPVGEDEWLQAIEKLVPRKALEANRNAFLAGRRAR